APSNLAATVTPVAESPPRLRNEGILVVDDESPILDLAQIALKRHGYRVFTASNGSEAVETYTRHRDDIDLVLMDIAMPVMDGHAAILALHTINPKLLIVASSGHASTHPTDSQIAAFIPKPYTAETLIATLDRVLADSCGIHPPKTLQPNRHNSTTPASSALARSPPPDNTDQ
ncbi:MAG: response regulator, partial [Verrucomicrobiia bacterium]